jgi:hypothetical protein
VRPQRARDYTAWTRSLNGSLRCHKQTLEHDGNSWPSSFVRGFAGLRYDCNVGSLPFALVASSYGICCSSNLASFTSPGFNIKYLLIPPRV